MNQDYFRLLADVLRATVVVTNGLLLEFASFVPPSLVHTIVPRQSWHNFYNFLTRLPLNIDNRENYVRQLEDIRQAVAWTFHEGLNSFGYSFELRMFSDRGYLELYAVPEGTSDTDSD